MDDSLFVLDNSTVHPTHGMDFVRVQYLSVTMRDNYHDVESDNNGHVSLFNF